MKETFDRVSGQLDCPPSLSLSLSSGQFGKNGKRPFKYRKLGASFAVIVGHVVPFMGAQTTIVQRFFLPHPLDTIISQPFGMTEDLVSMAMAEAISNPVLASLSLTALIASFNLARGLIFSGRHPAETADINALPCNNPHTPAAESNHPSSRPVGTVPNTTGIPSDPTPSLEASESDTLSPLPDLDLCKTACITRSLSLSFRRSMLSSRSSMRSGTGSSTCNILLESHTEVTDLVALASAVINVLVGVAMALIVGELTIKAAFCVVAVQMLVQLLLVPMGLGFAEEQLKECAEKAEEDCWHPAKEGEVFVPPNGN